MIDSIATKILYACTDKHIISDVQQFKDILLMELEKYNITEKENAVATYDERINYGYQMFFVAKTVEGLSKNSLKYYKTVIDDFIKCAGKTIDKITADDARYVLACKKRDGRSNTTLNNIRHVMSSFYTFLTNENYVLKNPISAVKTIKEEKRIKKPFSAIDVELIRDACRSFKNEIEIKRNLAIVEALLSTGCRVSELTSIKINDIDFGRGKCTVLGKGNKERVVFFNDASLLRINEYLEKRNDSNEYLFVSSRYKEGGITAGAIERLIRLIGQRAGVENCHPHRFRRTMACNAMKKGMPIEQIQTLLGHENIATTKIYLCIDTDNLSVEHRKYLG